MNAINGKTLIEFDKPKKNGFSQKKNGLNHHYQTLNGNGHAYSNGHSEKIDTNQNKSQCRVSVYFFGIFL
jgi:hypothetical protein